MSPDGHSIPDCAKHKYRSTPGRRVKQLSGSPVQKPSDGHKLLQWWHIGQTAWLPGNCIGKLRRSPCCDRRTPDSLGGQARRLEWLAPRSGRAHSRICEDLSRGAVGHPQIFLEHLDRMDGVEGCGHQQSAPSRAHQILDEEMISVDAFFLMA